MAPKKAARKHLPKKTHYWSRSHESSHPFAPRAQFLLFSSAKPGDKDDNARHEISKLSLDINVVSTINQTTRISQNMCAMYVFHVHYVYDYIESWNILHFLWFTDPFHHRVTVINLWTHTPKCLTSEQLGEQSNKQTNKQTKTMPNNPSAILANKGTTGTLNQFFQHLMPNTDQISNFPRLLQNHLSSPQDSDPRNSPREESLCWISTRLNLPGFCLGTPKQ